MRGAETGATLMSVSCIKQANMLDHQSLPKFPLPVMEVFHHERRLRRKSANAGAIKQMANTEEGSGIAEMLAKTIPMVSA